jgi:hypothetical protein
MRNADTSINATSVIYGFDTTVSALTSGAAGTYSLCCALCCCNSYEVFGHMQ